MRMDQLLGEHILIAITFILQTLLNLLTSGPLPGKRRALIPPSVGYTNEDLKPIPEEVSYMFYLYPLSYSISFVFPLLDFIE